MSDAMYLTCPHITKNILTYSLERIIDVENSSCSFACMSCDGVFPSLQRVQNHYAGNAHEIYVRIGLRPDLYCALCKDFQYCSFFDNIIGRKRKLFPDRDNEMNSASSVIGENDPTPAEVAKRKRKSCPGLINMGSTCFMNSVLQVLAHCRRFSCSSHFRSHSATCAYFNRHNGSSTGGDSRVSTPSQLQSCIPCEFSRVSQTLSGETESESYVIPSQLLYAIWSYVDYMAGYTQQDAHEFLIAFLNSLTSQLYQDQSGSSCRDFTKIFTGTVQSQLACTVCGNMSTTNENFIDLSLIVDRNAMSSSNSDVVDSSGPIDSPVDLLDSIEHFTSTESLHEKVKCEVCGIEQERTKRLRLVEIPDVLILHFKRFDFFRQKKVSRKIIFPSQDLNLRRFMLDEISDNKYELIGVVCHHGTLHQGHYISYIYDRVVGAWMKCDDENVSIVQESEVLSVEAYLLFYQRM